MPQAAEQKFVQVGPAPKVEGHGSAVDQAVDNAIGMANKLIDLHDFGEQQKVELERKRNANRMEEAMRKKLALSYDNPDSFYTPDGRLDEDKMNAFVSEWQQKNQGVKADFWRGTNEMKDAYQRDADNEQMRHSVQTALMGHELQQRRQAFEENLALAAERKDWDGMRDTLDAGLAAGQLSKKDHAKRKLQVDELEYKANQTGYMEKVAKAVMAGPEQFAALYDDADFRNKLSLENQQKLDSIAAKYTVDKPERKMREVYGPDGSRKVEAEPQAAPRGMTRGLVAVWDKWGGDFENNPNAKEEARPHLLRYLRGIVQHADDPSELEHAKDICKEYGHSAEWASSVVKQLRSEIDGTAPFNAREAMKSFLGQGVFFRPENKKKLDALRDKQAALLGVERTKEQEKELKLVKEQLAKWEGYDSLEYGKASKAILQNYDQWAQTHQGASYKEHARAFYNFVHNHRKDDATSIDVDKLADDVAGIHDRNLLKNKEQRRNAGVEVQADIKAADAARGDREFDADEEAKKLADERAAGKVTEATLDSTLGVSNRWEGNATTAILYVPKGHELAGQTVQIATPDDVCSAAEVVEQDGCTAPVMSQMLRRNLGLLKNPYSTLTFDGHQGTLSHGSVLDGRVEAKRLGGLAAYRDVFVDAAARNGLDPKLLMAIAMHETGRGTSDAFRLKKNAMGVSDANGPRRFGSVEESIYYMADQLRRNYVNQGLKTVEQIGRKYAPIGAKNDPRGLNQHWVGGVTKYMQELN